MTLYFHLDPIFIKPSHLQTTLTLFTHTVLFHRSMCLIRPKEMVDTIYYVKIDDDQLDQKTSVLIQHIVQNFSNHMYKNLDSYHIDICLSLCKSQKKDSWFGLKEEIVEFENWKIPITVLSPIDKSFSVDEQVLFLKMVHQIANLSENYLPLPLSILQHISQLRIDLYQEDKEDKKDSIFNSMMNLIKTGPAIPFSI